MYFIYSLLLLVGVTLYLPRVISDAIRYGKYATGLAERLGGVARLEAGGRPVVWLHCVSVGETHAARPLVESLVKLYPAHALVVSTTTLTGQRVARDVFKSHAASVFYFPLDWAWTVRRALDRINPSVVLVMETELWPRFLRVCRARRIPVALVNGRISPRSFRNYRLIRFFISDVVNNLTRAIMQAAPDAGRIAALGLAPERIEVSGNIKFDAGEESNSLTTGELRERYRLATDRPLIVAASTHDPEERILLDAFKRICESESERRPRLLIAPRHPERFTGVAALLADSGLAWSRRAAPHAASDPDADVILLDTIGELRAVYPLAALVFVGGSIARTGGHNVLEPATDAKCIVTGAHTFNFETIVSVFREHDALVQLTDTDDARMPHKLAHIFSTLLADDARRHQLGHNARAVLEQNRGASRRTLDMLAPLLQAEADGQRPDVEKAIGSATR